MSNNSGDSEALLVSAKAGWGACEAVRNIIVDSSGAGMWLYRMHSYVITGLIIEGEQLRILNDDSKRTINILDGMYVSMCLRWYLYFTLLPTYLYCEVVQSFFLFSLFSKMPAGYPVLRPIYNNILGDIRVGGTINRLIGQTSKSVVFIFNADVYNATTIPNLSILRRVQVEVEELTKH